ncbi:unnamed protein product [Chondrus crispus]|uniref:Uncharacterized protein n=1 Tax=Chondrus crispus TaxID=2769 RepID=R7Q3M9_CHOCR|nr:unnamed protein product [Chondrus crispus]CDF32080.1 unnamed protein product [Chondrus crispus]|eukprot:XP_005711745.1 unnamed protein product [Chondrus crispus]
MRTVTAGCTQPDTKREPQKQPRAPRVEGSTFHRLQPPKQNSPSNHSEQPLSLDTMKSNLWVPGCPSRHPKSKAEHQPQDLGVVASFQARSSYAHAREVHERGYVLS